MNDHVKGILITAIGVLLVVPDSLFVRLIYAEPIVIAFWRSLTSGVFVLIIVIYFYIDIVDLTILKKQLINHHLINLVKITVRFLMVTFMKTQYLEIETSFLQLIF